MQSTGQMTAALLGWPPGHLRLQASSSEAGGIKVTREIDGGLQTIEVILPPSYQRPAPERAALCLVPNIMKAKSSLRR